MESSRNIIESSRSILEPSRSIIESSRSILEPSNSRSILESSRNILEAAKLTRGLSESDARKLMYYAEEEIMSPPSSDGSPSTPQHPRSSSYSQLASSKDKPVNLNHSFPCYESLAPYISSSVTIPANLQPPAPVSGSMMQQGSSSGAAASSSSLQQLGASSGGPPDDQGFYQNVSGRIRQSELSLQEKARFEGRASTRNSRVRDSTDGSKHFDLHKSPRTQELEEFAARFDGYQMQRSRRLVHPTPMLDQLTRDWLPAADPTQLTSLETSLLKLVQRNDSINNRSAGPRHFLSHNCLSDDNSSGRESVTTVVSNSSSETLKYNEPHSCDRIPSDFGEARIPSRGCDFGDNVGIPPRGSFQELVRDQHNLNCDPLRAIRDSSPSDSVNEQYPHPESSVQDQGALSRYTISSQHGSLSRRSSYKVSGDGTTSDEICEPEHVIRRKSPLAALEEEQSRKLHISLTASWSMQNKATRYSSKILETDLDNVDMDSIWRDRQEHKESKNRPENRLMNEGQNNLDHYGKGQTRQDQTRHVMVSGGPNQSWWQEENADELPTLSQRDRQRNGSSSQPGQSQLLEDLLHHQDRCHSQMSEDSLQPERCHSQLSTERSASQLSNDQFLQRLNRGQDQLQHRRSHDELVLLGRSHSQLSDGRSHSQLSDGRSHSQLSDGRSHSQLSDDLLLQRRSFSQLSDELLQSDDLRCRSHLSDEFRSCSQQSDVSGHPSSNQEGRHKQMSGAFPCTFCLAIHSDNSEKCLSARRHQNNAEEFAYKNTYPRRSSRRRKPKLPTPPRSPTTRVSPESRVSTPDPPPPPPPTIQDHIADNDAPLPPPPSLPLPLPPPPPGSIHQQDIRHLQHSAGDRHLIPKQEGQARQLSGHLRDKEPVSRQHSGHLQGKEGISRQHSGQEKETIRRQLSGHGQEKEVIRRLNSGQLHGKEEIFTRKQQDDVVDGQILSRQRSYSLSRQNDHGTLPKQHNDNTIRQQSQQSSRQRGDILARQQSDTAESFAKQKADGLSRQDTLSRHDTRNDTPSRNGTLNRQEGQGRRNETLSRQTNETLSRQTNETLSRQTNETLSRQTSATPHRQPAATPKRDSPATIAAKEAPGWQMFLGVKSSTVSFTTEEVSKFRAARDESRGRRKVDRGNRDVASRWESQQAGRESQQGRNQQSGKVEERPGRSHSRQRAENKTQRTSPVDDKQQSLHLSRERSLKSISNWWKSSLESGPPPPAPGEENGGFVWREAAPAHNHSHSDSGISSLSGRSSCMSPMSVLSSSSGSSRTSLRSSSIVSASNIILDEEHVVDEEMEFVDLCKRVAHHAPPQSRIPSIIRTSLNSSLQVYFPEGSLEFEIISSGKENCELLSPETPKRGRPSNFEDCRKSLLCVAGTRLDDQRRQQQRLKEAARSNEDCGKGVMERLGKAAAQGEMDKVKLFTEEVDKITSLLIGLCGRLNKVNRDVSINLQTDGDAQRSHLERREKLQEQVEEATKLRQSIFKRGEAVFLILAKYLQPEQINAFGAFIRQKIRLIVDLRQHSEMLKSEEELLKCLKESVI